MKQNHIISKSSEKKLNYKNYFLKNIFDENFLNEKDKALSPIVLSDIIPEEKINKTQYKRKNFIANEAKDSKYGSNIKYIDSNVDDNIDEFHEILNEQICKIVNEQKLLKKFQNGRRKKKNI